MNSAAKNPKSQSANASFIGRIQSLLGNLWIFNVRFEWFRCSDNRPWYFNHKCVSKGDLPSSFKSFRNGCVGIPFFIFFFRSTPYLWNWFLKRWNLIVKNNFSSVAGVKSMKSNLYNFIAKVKHEINFATIQKEDTIHDMLPLLWISLWFSLSMWVLLSASLLRWLQEQTAILHAVGFFFWISYSTLYLKITTPSRHASKQNIFNISETNGAIKACVNQELSVGVGEGQEFHW